MHRNTKRVIVLLAFSLVSYTLYATAYEKKMNKKRQPGIDISHYQGNPDWKQLKEDGIRFAFIKVTQGTTLTDSKWERNRDEGKANNILYGYYHYFEPDHDVAAQAQHFIKTVGSVKNCLPPVIDVEILEKETPQSLSKKVSQWISIVSKELHCKPIVYSNHDFYKDNLEKHLPASWLWLADYTKGYDFRKDHDLIFAQYSQSGKEKGIQGDVDLDWFEGTYKELKKLLCN